MIRSEVSSPLPGAQDPAGAHVNGQTGAKHTALVAGTLVTMSLVATVLKAGTWPIPGLHYQFSIAQALTSNPDANYLYTSYLQPATFRFLSLPRTLDIYALYCAALAVLFLIVFTVALVHVHGASWKLVGIIAFPIILVPIYWVGLDGGTLLLVLAVTLTLNSPWSWLFAVLLSWQHPEQGTLGFSVLALTLLCAGRRVMFRRVMMVVAVLLVGQAALAIYFVFVDVRVSHGRILYAWRHFAEFARMWLLSWPAILWSLCGAGWLLLLVQWRRVWPIFTAVPVVMVTLIVVTDHTRVGVIGLSPALAYWVFFNRDFWQNLKPLWLSGTLALHLIVPVTYVWGGLNCGSVLEHTIRQFRTSPWISQWTRLDYLYPFINGVCPRFPPWAGEP